MLFPFATLLQINKKISSNITNLAKNKFYSVIEINLDNECKYYDLFRECSLDSCTSENFKMNSNGSYTIDLLKVPEINTNYKDGAKEVWQKLMSLTDNKLYQKLLSGVHFSVSVHISAFYKKKFRGYRKNYLYYVGHCSEKYKNEFIFTYQFLLTALLKLNDDRIKRTREVGFKIDGSSKELKSLQKEIFLIQKELKKHNFMNSYDFRNELMDILPENNLVSDIKFPNDEKVMNNKKSTKTEKNKSIKAYLDQIFDTFEKTLTIIPCMQCQRCHLWSKIQFIGLKSATKLLFTNEKLLKEDLICFVNLLKLFSESLIESYKIENDLEECKKIVLTFINYKNDISVCLFTLFVIYFLYSKIRKYKGLRNKKRTNK
ncbi:Endoplasmic reticulum oxidoreductin-2 [Dictyocoela muelleri]|nr:Endoplasmic reticulum oxidoreductin-2 [Dictyocoela muelleri]